MRRHRPRCRRPRYRRSRCRGRDRPRTRAPRWAPEAAPGAGASSVWAECSASSRVPLYRRWSRGLSCHAAATPATMATAMRTPLTDVWRSRGEPCWLRRPERCSRARGRAALTAGMQPAPAWPSGQPYGPPVDGVAPRAARASTESSRPIERCRMATCLQSVEQPAPRDDADSRAAPCLPSWTEQSSDARGQQAALAQTPTRQPPMRDARRAAPYPQMSASPSCRVRGGQVELPPPPPPPPSPLCVPRAGAADRRGHRVPKKSSESSRASRRHWR
jgi:hypothetical protein